ncbi:MAG: type II toxin-antitoxin system PemK/MazF family toxin [Cyclobacteriaceae bacterium]
MIFPARRLRPAVCLTEETGIYQHITIAFISSQTEKNPTEADILIEESEQDFASTGLAINSVIKLHKMVTVPKSIIKRKLGELSPAQQQEVKRKLREIFALD